MPIDAEIPLMYDPKPLGPDPNQTMSMLEFAQKFRQNQQVQKNQNALRQIFAAPDAFDPKTGEISPATVKRAYQVDPQVGMTIQQNTIESHLKRLQTAAEEDDVAKNKLEFGTEAAGVGVDAYDAALKAGRSKEDANDAATKARNEFIKENASRVGDADGALATPFNIDYARPLSNLSPERVRAKHDQVLEDVALGGLGVKQADAGLPVTAGTSGASPPAGSVAATNIANNNPGNIKTADGKGFQSFPSMQAGIDAVGSQIDTYRKRDGLDTIDGIVSKYAPPSENDTKAYVAKVAAQTGIPPNQKLAGADIPKVRDAMISFEQGGKTTDQLLEGPIATGKGFQVMYSPSLKTDVRYNPARAVTTDMNGKPITNPGDLTKPQSAQSSQEQFTAPMGELMAALAEKGVSLPTGFRSKAQQVELYKGILERNPGKSADEIADLVKKGQIELGAQKKETQTAAAIAGKVEVAQNELEQFLPLVREAAAKVPRGQFVPLTRLEQMADTAISDPNLKALKIRINSLLNAYDQLASRGGTDVAKRAEVRSLLSSADSPEAFNAALDSFEKEAEAAHKAAVAATKVPELAEDKPAKQSAGSKPKILKYDAKGNLISQ